MIAKCMLWWCWCTGCVFVSALCWPKDTSQQTSDTAVFSLIHTFPVTLIFRSPPLLPSVRFNECPDKSAPVSSCQVAPDSLKDAYCFNQVRWLAWVLLKPPPHHRTRDDADIIFPVATHYPDDGCGRCLQHPFLNHLLVLVQLLWSNF